MTLFTDGSRMAAISVSSSYMQPGCRTEAVRSFLEGHLIVHLIVHAANGHTSGFTLHSLGCALHPLFALQGGNYLILDAHGFAPFQSIGRDFLSFVRYQAFAQHAASPVRFYELQASAVTAHAGRVVVYR
jgi:hypothetical protein